MKKGFTLIELVIVIGILAILAAAVVLVLNPAQLLAQARDSQRMSDLSSIKSAIGLYLATANTVTLGVQARSTFATACGLTGNCTINSIVLTDGTGWVGVVLNDTSGGSPISALPLDPLNNANYQYAYQGDNTNKTFELNGRLESTKYRDAMINDGGNRSTCSTYIETTGYYEVGTDAGLDL